MTLEEDLRDYTKCLEAVAVAAEAFCLQHALGYCAPDDLRDKVDALRSCLYKLGPTRIAAFPTRNSTSPKSP